MSTAWGKIVLAVSLALMTAGSAGAQGPGSFANPTGEPFWTDRYRQERQRSREDAISRYNYCPTSGCVVRLESVEAKPKEIRRGQDLHLSTTYTLLTASDVAIPVRFSREIFFQGQSLGKNLSVSTRNYNGTWTQESDITLPADAARGTYTIRTEITTAYGSDAKTVQFTIY